jgi:chloramphenicol 3-O phosphotransferase
MSQLLDPSAGLEIPAKGPAGRVIFLNGTSSSGKSSIAEQLLALLDEPHYYMPVDAFHGMRAGGDVAPEDLQRLVDRTCLGFHRAVAGMAAGGNNVVMDHVISQHWRLLDCLDLFAPEDVVLVGVHCPLPELERREQARGNRPLGLAARQLARVHAHGLYDVECDTGVSTPLECARQILDHLPRRTSPTAFQRLRSRFRSA